MKYSLTLEYAMSDDEAYIRKYKLMSIDEKDVKEGDNFDELLSSLKGSNRITVSDLRVEGLFIINFLYKNGYASDEDAKTLKRKYTFNTLISEANDWYRICVKAKQGTIQFENFTTKMGTTVQDYIKSMHLDDDTNKAICHAIRLLESHKLDELTIGSACVKEFKRMGYCKGSMCEIGKDEEEFIRKAYKGGLCEVLSDEQTVEEKITAIDMNSMYPHCMYKYAMPAREGRHVTGKCEGELYIQHFKATVRLKKGKLPCLQENMKFWGCETIYWDKIEATLTSVDMENMFNNYDVTDIKYIDGYEYCSVRYQYLSYIEKWYANKLAAKREGNKSLYYLSKLMLNNLAGKLAAKKVFSKRIIQMNENGMLEDGFCTIASKDWYLPAACFITSYARKELCEMADILTKAGCRVLYYDTDSLHFAGELKDLSRIDNEKLGFWKVEGTYKKGIYLKQKVYAEQLEDGEWEYTVAGCPGAAKEQLNEDNFKEGTVLKIKQMARVKGGCIIRDTTFTL